eukprot:GHVN01102434.1.p1 GENE.GHVN01102434.1~~GHVN01102434.1.p1  ORF type:complete len:187 (+),score=36.63 GHVN01102434.1:187-747(+)
MHPPPPPRRQVIHEIHEYEEQPQEIVREAHHTHLSHTHARTSRNFKGCCGGMCKWHCLPCLPCCKPEQSDEIVEEKTPATYTAFSSVPVHQQHHQPALHHQPAMSYFAPSPPQPYVSPSATVPVYAQHPTYVAPLPAPPPPMVVPHPEPTMSQSYFKAPPVYTRAPPIYYKLADDGQHHYPPEQLM